MNAGIWRSKLKNKIDTWLTHPERVYVVIALIGVIGFALITPPFQGPDEEAHYVRAQYIAHGFFIPVDVKDGSASLPQSIENTLYVTFFKDDIRGDTNNKYELSRTKDALLLPQDKDDRYKPIMVNYSPIPYLPAVPGIFLSNLLNVNSLLSMYIARLSLGLASILLMFFAIRLIPHKKYLFVAIGLIPMILFQQAVVTADSISYALLALFIAYVFYLRGNKRVSKRQWLTLGVICVGVTLAKPLLYLFLPLVLLLVNKKSDLKWIIGIASVCIVALLGWSMAVSTKSEVLVVSGVPSAVDESGQLETILSSPKRAARVMWNSYMTTFGDDEVRGIIGIFGAADVVYPLWMVIVYASILGLLYILRLDERRVKISKMWKLLAAVLCIVYFLAVNLALYTNYTPVNFDIVYGVQGRYFLPILIIAAAVIFVNGIRVANSDAIKVKRFTMIAVAVLVAMALLVTIQRYYLYTP